MWRTWCILLVVVLLVGGLIPARAQGEDVERARANALAWLLKEINKPNLILVQYTYLGSSWEDSGMGCPAPGQTVTPGLVNGYIWTFLFDNQVRYEVHSSFDGAQSVLCSSRNEGPDVQLSTYTTTLFTLLIPEAWLIYPNSDGTQVLFAPQQEVTCTTPGMRVTSMGRVASGVTPDNLIDDYMTEAGVQDDPATRLTVGSFGRTATIQTPCESGVRDLWISGFVQYGDGYIVEQWSPADQTPQLEPLFAEMIAPFGPADSAETAPTTTDTTTSDGEAAPPAPLAPLPLAHLFIGDVFLGQLDDIPGRSVTSVPTQERRYLGFSPNGLFLSYIDSSDNQLRVLDVTNGVSPRKIAEEVSPLFPPAWNADNQQIAYVSPTDETDPNGMPVMELRSVTVKGGDPTVLTSFALTGDCSTPLSDPADKPYFVEAGPGGEDHVLIWLSNNQFLISLRCEGGLALLDPATSGITVLGTDLQGGVLSPDGQRFAARGSNGLAILELPGGQRSDLGKGADARAVAWSQDGQSIYYSTESEVDSLTLDDPAAADRGEAVFGFWPVTVVTYNLSLVRLDLSSSTETTIWHGQGRGIGRIAPAPDGSGVLFTVIPTGQTLAEVFQAGGDPLAVREAWPTPSLYWLQTGGTVPLLLAYAGSPVFAPITITPPAPVAGN